MNSIELKQKIISAFKRDNIEKIIIFGSRAKGTDDSYSDIDLIIILNTNKRFLDRLKELYQLWSVPIAIDILAYTPDEFNQMLSEKNPLIEKAVEEGEVLYEKPVA
ncbi:MAG: hypothetical protein COS89_07165 [Deltaproteobacteria bacterium CG07_land_8_20_14_0_80_38_7]|nr:MAG: hypothetical protein COS89_07165 [Deltaproteobacteria bacterium CG07_land_8_20_14_0_80_38_7]